jgi:hypothetical protein
MTIRALEVKLPYAPSKRRDLLKNCDQSREQTVITGYATDPPEAAISIPLLPAARAGKPSAISRRAADYYRRGHSDNGGL